MSYREAEDLTKELQSLAVVLRVKYDPAYERNIIMRAVKRIQELEKQNSDYGWTISPDRMGG